MHYIRFLKPPKLVATAEEFHIDFVLTIATDLGDKFFPYEVVLVASAKRENADSDGCLGKQQLTWKVGSRALTASIPTGASSFSDNFSIEVRCLDPTWENLNEFQGTILMPVVVPIFSKSLQPARGIVEAEKLALRKIKLLNGSVLSIWEDTGHSIARHIWDAGLALIAHLDRAITHQGFLSNIIKQKINVIELGTGCGLVGLAIAALNPDSNVLLTDTEEVESFIKTHNLRLEDRNISYANVDWTFPLPEAVQTRQFDLIIAADCIYNPDSSPSLVKTIDALERNSPGAKVVVATKTRHPSEAIFFDLIQNDMNFVVGNQAVVFSPSRLIDVESEEIEKIDIYTFSRSIETRK